MMLRLAVAALVLAGAAEAQTADRSAGTPGPPSTGLAGAIAAEAGVAPDTVTVGDPFLVRLRVQVPADASVTFGEFTLIEPVEAVDSIEAVREASGGWTVTYRLRAWVPSDSLVGRFPFRARWPDGRTEDRQVRVRLPVVRSVLPADTSLHRPRPAKAAIPIHMPSPGVRGWIGAAAALLLLAAVVYLLVRTRRGVEVRPRDPRSVALAELDAIERDRLIERGALEAYHVRSSRVLRRYLAWQCGWGEDLTSAEVVSASAASGAPQAATSGLEALLRQADRVKFAGGDSRAEAQAALAFGRELRDWISRYPAARPETASPTAEAA